LAGIPFGQPEQPFGQPKGAFGKKALADHKIDDTFEVHSNETVNYRLDPNK
jgi:hypothetical protein